MFFPPQTVGYGAYVGVPVLLATFAVLLWRRRDRIRGGRWLAPYLGLVALGYALDCVNVLLNFLAQEALPARPWSLAVRALSRLDTAPLLLFALELKGFRPSPTAAALVLAPCLAMSLLLDPAWSTVAALHLIAYYGAALVLVGLAWLDASTPLARERLGVLVLAMSVVVLPRIPLIYFDLGHGWGAEARAQPASILPLEGGLALVTVLAALGLLLRAPPSRRPEAARLLASVGALMVAIDAVWIMRFLPGLDASAYGLTYSARWFLFGAVLVVGDRRHAVFEVAKAREARIALFGALVVLGVSQVAALLAGLDGVSAPLALMGGAAVVGLAAVTLASVHGAFPPLDPDALRRREAFRAQAALAASPGEAERLRVAWGIDAEEAERLAREAPSASPVEWPSIGGVFASRYAVEDLAGAGGFGRAFAAWDRARGERVVLKELVGPLDEDAKRRLAAEVEAAARLSHPNLVGFRSLERGARGPVLVLQHVEGETLRARLARGPLPPSEASRLSADLLGALHALHQAGIVHRDVKPENVILRPDGRAVLLDFGAASLRGGATTRPVGPHPGTPAYMSPEQAEGRPLDVRADVYAAGVVLWEALTGSLPPGGNVPQAWRPVLARALARDAGERWASAQALASALPR